MTEARRSAGELAIRAVFGGGDDEVAGAAAGALGGELVEDGLLERVRPHVEVEGEGVGGVAAALLGEGGGETAAVALGVVLLELALLPVLLEGGLELAQDVGRLH